MPVFGCEENQSRNVGGLVLSYDITQLFYVPHDVVKSDNSLQQLIISHTSNSSLN